MSFGSYNVMLWQVTGVNDFAFCHGVIPRFLTIVKLFRGMQVNLVVWLR